MKPEEKLTALRLIRQAKKLTRQELARQMNISLSQATKMTADLISRGLIFETGKLEAGSSGRQADFLALVPEAAYAVGLHVSNIRRIAVVTNLNGDVLAHLAEPVVVTDDRNTIIRSMKDLARRVVRSSGISNSAIAGLGVGLSDIVDPVARVSHGWPDMPGWSAAWTGFPVGEALAAVLDYPHILVDDIVRTLGIAEARYGRGTQEKDFVYILIDRGIGMAVMMNGIPYIGHSHIAGEIAHIPIGPSTEPCVCGNVGCLCTLTGIPVALALAHRRLEESPIHSELRQLNGDFDIQSVFSAADKGDKLAIQVLTETGENLGKALAVIVNLLGPHSIVLGGAMSKSPHFVDAAQRAMRMHALAPAGRGVSVDSSSLDELGGARGAATQVLDELFSSSQNNLLNFKEFKKPTISRPP